VIVQDFVFCVASHFHPPLNTSPQCIRLYAPPAAALIWQERRG
jgi:hypothetical protein